jgi:predicted RNase H-like nuclease (RuvC/YqgF family)
MPEDFTPITSQEQLDSIISKRVKEEKELREEVENLKTQLEAKDAEIATLQKTHSLQRELDKRGLDQPVMQGKLETIRKLIDLDSETDPAEQLESLSKQVPELFRVPQGAGSGRLAPRSTLTPVLDREEPLTEEDIAAMSPEQIAKTPGLMERIDRFMSGQR